jgi:predicted thioredoxin/glutaredoxin
LDYKHWLLGFATLPELFEWVMASPYFSVKPYQEELAGAMEKRLDRRSTIQKFADYLLDNQILTSYEYLENKEDYLPIIDSFFPEADLLAQIAAEKAQEETVKRLQEKFNGNLLMEWLPGISGKELGQFIQDFKRQFVDFEAFVLNHKAQEVKQQVLDFYAKNRV